MEFSVAERVMIGNVLPSFHGDVLSLRVVQDLIRELGFDAEEQIRFGMVSDNGMVRWDVKLEETKEINVNRRTLNVIRQVLNQASDEGILRVEYLPIYDRMMATDLMADEV